MNSLQNSLLDAMSAMSKSAVEKQNNVLAIEAEIVEVVDSGLGLYKVRYLENYFNVYSNNTANNYNPGDTVSIIIPSGDFSKDKFIIGTADATAQTYVPSDVETVYEEVSGDLLLNDSTIRMRTYHSEVIPLSIRPDETEGIAHFNSEVSAYLRTYDTLGLFCNIKTDMPTEQQLRGNYGLKLSLPIIRTLSNGETEEDYKEVNLDTSNIKGNPYGLLEESSQKIYIKFSDNETYDTAGTRPPLLQAFVEGFNQSDDYESLPYDIFINSIELKSINVLTPDLLTGYYLTLKTDTGNFFLRGQNEKVITPTLRINGKVTSQLEQYDCYWFEEDSSIRPGDDNYVPNIGGSGWKCLNSKSITEDNAYAWNNEYKLKIYKSDILLSKNYKCVLIVNDSNNNAIQLSKEIDIVDLTTNVDIRLVTNNLDSIIPRKGIATVSCIVDVKDSGFNGDNFKFIWTINGSTEIPYAGTEGEPTNPPAHEDNTTVWTSTISFITDNFTNSSIDVGCFIKYSTLEEVNDSVARDSNNEVILDEHGNVVYNKKTITVEKSFASRLLTLFLVNIDNYFVTFKNNNILYKYDASGNSPMVGQYDGPVGSIIKSIQPVSFEVRDKYGTLVNGNSFTTTWIVPADDETMLDLSGYDYSISNIGYSDFQYQIKPVYDSTKKNNTVILKLNVGDVEVTAPLNFQFLKDGESGTNGTSYSAIVKFLSSGKYWGLNERDNQGRRRNAKLIYIGENNVDTPDTSESSPYKKWYFYGYGDDLSQDPINGAYPADESYYNLLGDRDGQRLDFIVDLYKDGRKIEDNSLYDVTWEFYDRVATNTCLYVETRNRHGVIIAGDPWSDYEDVYCNILRAKITIKAGQSSTAPQILYSYYPIEISRLSNIAEIESKTREGVGLVGIGYNGTVPTLLGGFYDVLYSSDGKDPLYDSTTPFMCVDDLDEVEYNNYEYAWFSNSNLTSEVVQSEENITNNDIEYDRNNSAIVKPVTNWTDHDSKNYVKVMLSWGEETVADFNAEVQKRIEDDLIEQAWVKFYVDPSEYVHVNNNYRQDLLVLLNDYDKVTLAQNLDDSKDLIELRSDCIEALKLALLRVDFWYNYTGDYVNSVRFYTSCLDKYDAARVAMTELCDSYKNGTYGLDQLKDLSSPASFVEMIAYIDDDILTNIIPNMSIDEYEELQEGEYKDILSKTLVELTVNYQKGFTALKKTSGGTYVLLTQAEAFYNYRHSYTQILADTQVLCIAKEVRNKTEIIDYNEIREYKWVSVYNTISQCLDSLVEDNTRYNDIKVKTLEPLIDELDPYYDKQDDEVVIAQSEVDHCNEMLEYHTARQIETAAALDSIYMEGNTSEASIVHIRPIVFRMNTYGMSSINGWDGNKIDINEDGKYIYAPQVGAGIKDDENTFTGMIMGTIYDPNAPEGEKEKVGLYGFSHGQTSFALSAFDGSAHFGLEGKGRISIIPDEEHAVIEGGLYSPREVDPITGQVINEGSGLRIDLTEPSIRFGNDNFSVDKDGHLHAVDGDFTGTINATGGKIGGWTVHENTLESQAKTSSSGKISKLVLSSSASGTYKDDAFGDFICINPQDPEQDRDYVGIQKFYRVNPDVHIDNIRGEFIDYKLQIYLSDNFELDYRMYPNTYLTDSPYEARKYSYDEGFSAWVEDFNGKYLALVGDGLVDSDGVPLFIFKTYDWDNQEEVLIENETGDGEYLKAYVQPDDWHDYGLGLFPSEEETFPGDEVYPQNGRYVNPIPPTGYCFKIAQRVYSDVHAEMTFDTNEDLYCQLMEFNSLAPYYLIEKGYIEADIWYKDYINGDKIKIRYNRNFIISPIYAYSDGEYVENQYGDYIKVNNQYYKMSNFVQFIEVIAGSGYKPRNGYVLCEDKTVKGKTNAHDFRDPDNPIYRFPEVYRFQQGAVINDVWYTSYDASGRGSAITVWGTFKIWNVDEATESGGYPYTDSDFVYRHLQGPDLGTGIYSGEHTNYFSTADGFYLGEKGLSLGPWARISADNDSNEFFFTASNNGKYKNSTMYIGNDGISAGYSNFYVGGDGKLVAKDVDITGKITSNDGNIGGFAITYNGLEGSRLKLNPNGSIDFGQYGTIERVNGSGKESVVWYNQMVDYIANYGAKVKVRVVTSIPTYIETDTIYLLKGTYVPYYTYRDY